MFTIDKTPFTIAQVSTLLHQDTPIELGTEVITTIEKSAAYIQKIANQPDTMMYGINTGFGSLYNTQISVEQLSQLQTNLLRSHACGMGDEVPEPIVRLMILLKIKALAQGYSGVQLSTVQRLVDFWNLKITPVVYTQGSLGASGDLAPLAHLSLPLIGEGEVWYEGKKYTTEAILQQHQLQALQLAPKEGLALINGTQFIAAYGVFILEYATRLWQWANAIAAISLDAYDGRIEPFDPLIHQIRPHYGQMATAQIMRNWLEGSQLIQQSKQHVQDPYSFRCIPQVHGASLDVIRHVKHVFTTEINAVSDNPNIFVDEEKIISGGNFHAQPLALPLDYLSLALSELASISERRTYLLISGQRGLPAFLVTRPGINSGLMIPQYVAAGIVSENKMLCMPSSADSIPSSNGQEDHVSMGANGAVKCLRILYNVEKVLAIELFNAIQALGFRRPLQSSDVLEKIVLDYRKKVSFVREDRYLHEDLKQSVSFLQQYSLPKEYTYLDETR